VFSRQLETLEPLQPDERGIAVSIEAATNEQQADEIARRLQLSATEGA
jgi:gluconate kinase